MPLNDANEIRIAIDDARARHAAVVALIYFTDTQAMGLLRLYATLALATASGVAASLAGNATVPRPLAWALATATVVLIAGAAFCLRAMQSGVINLPGRGASFWLWASGPNVDQAGWARAYFDNLIEKSRLNEALNLRTARALRLAKLCAVALPIAAAAAGMTARFL
jgi:hypothetical protein